MNSYIYIIGVSTNPVKIGIARNLTSRLAGLQIGCPDELKLHHYTQVPDWAAAPVEKGAHRRMSSTHRRGEWFNVDADVAHGVVQAVARDVVDRGAFEDGRSKDPIRSLLAGFAVDDAAYVAVSAYQRMLHDAAARRCVTRINAMILKTCGAAALTVFRMVVIDRANLPASLYRDPKALYNAKAALAKAINVLADFQAFAREEEVLKAIDNIHGNVRDKSPSAGDGFSFSL